MTALGFSPNETLLATGDAKGVVLLWELSSGRMRRKFVGHENKVTSVMFSPDGRLLLTASTDHHAIIWDVRTAEARHVIRWHFGPVGGASFSPDGRWFVTAGPGSAVVGSVSTGRRQLILRGHAKPLIGAAFGGSDGQTIVAASKDGTVRIPLCHLWRSRRVGPAGEAPAAFRLSLIAPPRARSPSASARRTPPAGSR